MQKATTRRATPRKRVHGFNGGVSAAELRPEVRQAAIKRLQKQLEDAPDERLQSALDDLRRAEESFQRVREAAPSLLKWAVLLGGGTVYLEAFGRYCFCGSCRINAKPVEGPFHASSCDELNAACAAAEGRAPRIEPTDP